MKTNLKNEFARKKKLKDGREGKVWELPSIVEMHTDPTLIEKWLLYGTLDAELTYFLFHSLKHLMSKLPSDFEDIKNVWDIYDTYWRLFGEELTNLERRGIKVDIEYMYGCLRRACGQYFELRKRFASFVDTHLPESPEFNASSPAQMQQLLFAPFKRNKRAAKGNKSKVKTEEEQEDLTKMKRVLVEVNEFPEVRIFRTQKRYSFEELEEMKYQGTKLSKFYDMSIRGLGLTPIKWSMTGLPSVDHDVIRDLSNGVVQTALAERGQTQFGEELGEALKCLVQMKQIETLMSTFMVSLIDAVGVTDSRIHCSLNINTETGRLSSRRPNLQNQPSLDKDKFKTRLAFVCEKGNKLIVADYGQLELRVLAHMTKCRAMIDAFRQGGDFHSRTAANMFPEIRKELDSKKILLEKSNSQDGKDIPLLKDKYASERKKAKTMNFSIAYGKSAIGFSKDWNCSLEEAERTVQLWYSDRPEVLEWQEAVKRVAIEKGYTRTLVGRYRSLVKHFLDTDRRSIMHGLRAAINTPIQGGAADIVITAMVNICRDREIKDLGWILIHQVDLINYMMIVLCYYCCCSGDFIIH